MRIVNFGCLAALPDKGHGHVELVEPKVPRFARVLGTEITRLATRDDRVYYHRLNNTIWILTYKLVHDNRRPVMTHQIRLLEGQMLHKGIDIIDHIIGTKQLRLVQRRLLRITIAAHIRDNYVEVFCE